jgi:hypothetical protein
MRVEKGLIDPPEYILHVDKHHDMMDEKKTPGIARGGFIAHI